MGTTVPIALTSRADTPRFVENLEAIKRLWREDHVTFKGSHFELDDASLSIKPLQQPYPPIWIGANADGAVRRDAGRQLVHQPPPEDQNNRAADGGIPARAR